MGRGGEKNRLKAQRVKVKAKAAKGARLHHSSNRPDPKKGSPINDWERLKREKACILEAIEAGKGGYSKIALYVLKKYAIPRRITTILIKEMEKNGYIHQPGKKYRVLRQLERPCAEYMEAVTQTKPIKAGQAAAKKAEKSFKKMMKKKKAAAKAREAVKKSDIKVPGTVKRIDQVTKDQKSRRAGAVAAKRAAATKKPSATKKDSVKKESAKKPQAQKTSAKKASAKE